MNVKAIIVLALAALAAARSFPAEEVVDIPTEVFQTNSEREEGETSRAKRDIPTGGNYKRIALLNMTDPNQHCPPLFRAGTTSSGKRFCRRNVTPGCTSIRYTTGDWYHMVCGKVTGFQIGTVDAFDPYYSNRSIDINGVYVDGVSITKGANRDHIWTLAAGSSKQASNSYACPCTGNGNYTGVVPPFIGRDYSCESGNPNLYTPVHEVFDEDRLWDDMGCPDQNTCCRIPYFCKAVMPTDDYIEVRVCTDSSSCNGDVFIDHIELSVLVTPQ